MPWPTASEVVQRTGVALAAGDAWAVDTAYVVDDTVEHGGSVYVCILAHTSADPAGADEPGTGADWEDYWRLADDETSYGLDISDLIDSAKAFAESYCNRSFDEATVTETHDEGDMVFVDRPPIVEVDTLTVHGTDLDESDDEFYVYTTYILINKYSNGRIAVTNYYSPTPQAVEVTYTGGYSDAAGGIPIPAELSEVVRELACRALLRIDDQYRTAKGVKQLQVGNVNVVYANAQDQISDLLVRLDKFRSVVV